MQFTVRKATMWGAQGAVTGYKAVGYLTDGVNFPVESKITMVEGEAEEWAARATAGEAVPEADFGSYSDD